MTTAQFSLERDPQQQAQLVRSRARLLAPSRARERFVELLSSTLFGLTAALFVLVTRPGLPAVGTLLLLIAACGAALLVEFEVGSGYTAPSMLVLVPMLFLLPPAIVPVAVVSGHLLAYAVGAARGRRHVGRVLVVPGQAWHAFGAALVVATWSPGAAGWDDAPCLLAAFVAYVAFDAVSSLSVDHYGHGESVRSLMRSASRVYLIDLLLLPVALALTIAADGSVVGLAAVVPLVALLAGFASERRRRVDGALELSRAYRGTAMLLGNVVEHDDTYTGAHSRDVVDLAVAVGNRMRLGPASQRDLELAALLHDVGKISVPNEIINKPGPLDDDEWAIMKRHTIEGERMLAAVGGVLADVGRIVRASHERYDGNGYPDGLAGTAIPVEARICAACDAFSAMTSDRSYRRALPLEVALAELRDKAGTQFDPAVVDALIAEITLRPSARLS